MNRSVGLAFALALSTTLLVVPLVTAQGTDKPVANLRLAQDASGVGMALDGASSPGEKIYRLPAGVNEVTVAFDYQGVGATDVAVRMIGTSGTILFDEQKPFEEPGTHVIIFKQGSGPIPDGEYVVNAYVGDEQYLADSLQLAIGEAEIPDSVMTPLAQTPSAEAGGVIPTVAVAGGESSSPPNPFTPTLILALAGLLALVLVVLWAVRSAMRSDA